jgi:hypothetical protein
MLGRGAGEASGLSSYLELEHTVGTRAGGLAEIIRGPARRVGLELQTVRSEDV